MTSLYVHIPFCQRKCLYCSFKVFIGREKVFDAYLDALDKEAAVYHGHKLKTIYIGGGTPSLLTTPQIQRLSQIIREHFDVSEVEEWTIEANPEDVDALKAKVWADLGFRRVSLGVQSFQEKFLKLLGRCHTADRAHEAFHILRAAGISNINVDLMFGFPKQTASELQADIDAVIGLKSEHVSIYSLTVEPLSRFYVQQVEGLGQEIQAQFYELMIARLKAAGLEQYEISNFAKPGFPSIHNMNYWRGGDYIGMGVAAHSHDNGRRSWNLSDLQKYLDAIGRGANVIEGSELLSPPQRLLEALVFGLRLNAGVDVSGLEQQFGVSLPVEKILKIDELTQGGLLRRHGFRLMTTPRGRLVLDEVSVYLL